MQNRSQAPEIKNFKAINFVKPSIKKLNEDSNFYYFQNVPNDTSRIELYFNFGTITGKNGLASTMSSLLFSGSKTQNSLRIQELFDDLGVFKEVALSQEECVISIYCLNSNLSRAFDLIFKTLNEVDFPLKEVEEHLSQKKQHFEISMQKVGVLARRKFIGQMYPNSTYGRVLNIQDFEKTTREEIKAFYQNYFIKSLFKATLVGDVSNSEIDAISKKLMDWVTKKPILNTSECANNTGEFLIKKEGALQSAIRIGFPLFTKKDKRFIDFNILNTILGGYFGSRLMTNLREENGYTYGIGSYVSELNKSGVFVISTEVGKKHAKQAINEVKKEIVKLRTELVSLEELELVKNYLLGQLLKSADGAYAMMNLYIGLQKHGMDFRFYEQYVDRIFSITPNELRKCAIETLDWSKMTVVCAG